MLKTLWNFVPALSMGTSFMVMGLEGSRFGRWMAYLGASLVCLALCVTYRTLDDLKKETGALQNRLAK